MPSVRSSPDLLFKSASAVQISRDRDDNGEGNVNRNFELTEDPSFWKDHNVQVQIFGSESYFFPLHIVWFLEIVDRENVGGVILSLNFYCMKQ